MKDTQNNYDVIIVGGGIIGASTLYVLSKYTDVESIAVIEKQKQLGAGVSFRGNNSQTLHFGDIETNYSREKSKKVKQEASLLAGYIEQRKHERLYRKIHKMVLAVGEDEASGLRKRYESIKDIFPKLRPMERDEIAEVEPKIVEGRDPDTEIFALYNPDGHTVDYGKTAQSFAREANKTDTEIDYYFNTKVEDVSAYQDGYEVIGENDVDIFGEAVVMAVGAASLRFAHEMDLKKEWILLPVAGNFFCAPQLVDGKIYTVQLEGIPFAAVHADAAVDNPHETQFGPLAKILPMLERHNYDTVSDFFKLAKPQWDALKALLSIGLQPIYLQYILKQIIYDIPYLGRWAFLSEARKITPSISYGDLEEKKRHGGIRPQIVNTQEKALSVGEAKIVGDDIIFDITPSPGASVSLANAKKNAHTIEEFFDGIGFQEDQFLKDHQRPNRE